ncbi:MAG: protein translocase subunit SecF [Clostridia bacterium]|nr:protein translocase subunit SecF [Clostridia bacterium]
MEQKKLKASKLTEYFKSEKFKPSEWSKYFWILSGTIFLVGLIILCTIGFRLGLDFTGGNIMRVQVGEEINTEAVKNNVENTIKGTVSDNGAKVSRYQIIEENGTYYVEFQYQNINDDMTEVNTNIQNELTTKLNDVLTETYTVSASETKSASASGDLLFRAFIALAIAVVAILVYVAIRFELLSGLAAVITLFHDVLLMCALVLIFRIEVNSAFIAAVITILGYSVNNTIVVFDRVRENRKKESLMKMSNMDIANLSIKQTLTRTLNTSITTLLAVVMLAIIGVSAIRQFIVPIIFGLIVGTYAAIFISAPLWAKIITGSKFDKRKIQKTEKIDKKETLEDGEKVVETTAEPI